MTTPPPRLVAAGGGSLPFGTAALGSDLNALYQAEPALWRGDYEGDGFWWVDCSDHSNSVLSFVRHDRESGGHLPRHPEPDPESPARLPGRAAAAGGRWTEVLNSDAEIYGGSNLGNAGGRDRGTVCGPEPAPVRLCSRCHRWGRRLPACGLGGTGARDSRWEEVSPGGWTG